MRAFVQLPPAKDPILKDVAVAANKNPSSTSSSAAAVTVYAAIVSSWIPMPIASYHPSLSAVGCFATASASGALSGTGRKISW